MNEANLNKLTAEAEAGHGSFVRTALDQLSFQERIRILHKVQELSGEHHRRKLETPYLTVKAGATGDLGSAYLRLDRHAPHKSFFGLMDKWDTLYENFVEFSSGDELFVEGDVS